MHDLQGQTGLADTSERVEGKHTKFRWIQENLHNAIPCVVKRLCPSSRLRKSLCKLDGGVYTFYDTNRLGWCGMLTTPTDSGDWDDAGCWHTNMRNRRSAGGHKLILCNVGGNPAEGTNSLFCDAKHAMYARTCHSEFRSASCILLHLRAEPLRDCRVV